MQRLKDQILQNQQDKQTPENIRHRVLKKEDVKYVAPHLAKKIWFYFFLAILATFPLTASLIYEVGSERLHAQIVESITGRRNTALLSPSISATRAPETDEIGRILKRLQNRMLLVMSGVFLTVFVATFVFMRRVIKPLDEIGIQNGAWPAGRTGSGSGAQ